MATQNMIRTTRVQMGYISAVVSVFVTTLILYFFWDVFSPAPFIFILTTIVISSTLGGLWPGLLATLLSLVGFNAVIIIIPGEQYSWDQNTPILIAFLFVSVGISFLQHQRLQSRQELQDLKEQFEVILDNIADGVTAQHATGKITYANAAAARILGFPSPEAITQLSEKELDTRHEYFDPNGVPIKHANLPNFQSIRTGSTETGTFRFVDKLTDEARWVTLTTTPLIHSDKSLPDMINVFRDVSEQRRQEAETAQLNLLLNTHRNRLQNTLNNVPGIVWEGSVYGEKIEFVSDYAETLLGYDKKDWLTDENFWLKILHPDDLDHADRRMQRNIKHGKGEVIEFRCIAKDGREIPVQSHMTFLEDQQGEKSGRVCGVLIDITRRKRAEQALKRSTEALRRSNNELQQFAYVASHDLQEPLRMVNSYLQLIEKRYAEHLDDDGREFIGYAVDGANRMKALINDLLAFSRVETRGQKQESLSLNSLVSTVLKDLEIAITENNAEIQVGELPEVTGDRRQITQLFQNLISNALKFKHEERSPCIRISATRTDTAWQFAIEDNGIGIDPRYQERVFQIFQRLHPVGKYEGTGIGLAICKKVVERHDGKIRFESTPEVGTTFYFTLPLALV
jgi:PAS domain S-box-containing protein